MLPAEQVTLRHLLGGITNLTKDGYEDHNSLGIRMHHPDPAYGETSIKRFKDGASCDDPSRLAGITLAEHVGEDDRIITNYFILDTPDGLHIEKRSHSYNLRNLVLKPSEGIKRSEERQQAQPVEDELGLSFVSEQEARGLLSFLDESITSGKVSP
jgi:hypothetical protein